MSNHFFCRSSYRERSSQIASRALSRIFTQRLTHIWARRFFSGLCRILFIILFLPLCSWFLPLDSDNIQASSFGSLIIFQWKSCPQTLHAKYKIHGIFHSCNSRKFMEFMFQIHGTKLFEKSSFYYCTSLNNKLPLLIKNSEYFRIFNKICLITSWTIVFTVLKEYSTASGGHHEACVWNSGVICLDCMI